MKLSSLSPEDQAAVVRQRQEEMRLLQEYAFRTMDPLALGACELDAQARRLGIHMEFAEELDPEEEI